MSKCNYKHAVFLIYFADAIAFSNAYFGSGSGNIFINNAGCSGTESTLLDCTHSFGSNVNCYTGHNGDAGVRCQGEDKLISKKLNLAE